MVLIYIFLNSEKSLFNVDHNQHNVQINNHVFLWLKKKKRLKKTKNKQTVLLCDVFQVCMSETIT